MALFNHLPHQVMKFGHNDIKAVFKQDLVPFFCTKELLKRIIHEHKLLSCPVELAESSAHFTWGNRSYIV